MPIYMQYDGIDGAVTTKGLEKWIELESLQFATSRGMHSAARSAAIRESTDPSISEIVITKRVDKTSPQLFRESLAGAMKATVRFKFTTTAKDKVETYLSYELSNCGVSSYSLSGSGGIVHSAPSESLAINCTKIMVTYIERDEKIRGTPNTTGYDLQSMQPH